MAKRSNPFSEDYVPQSKVHIGAKQFNNTEVRLRKIYDKTLNLLFRGAKGKNVASPMTIDAPSDSSQIKLKQMFIGKNGVLEERDGAVVISRSPVPCICMVGASECSCAYCEAHLCQQCAHICTACEQPYCARCCINMSDVGDTCVSCYK